MKIRLDFVTNSSSTSFLIKKIDKKHKTRSAKLSKGAAKLKAAINKMFLGKYEYCGVPLFDCLLNAFLIAENGDKSLVIEVHDNYESYMDMIEALDELKDSGLFKFYEEDSNKRTKVIKIY